MESSVLFLTLFSMLQQVAFSEIRLSESGGGVVKPGESLRLTCLVSGHIITSTSHAWSWIRQAPNKGLEWIGEGYYSRVSSQWKPSYAPPFQNRVSISLDSSKNEYDLQLTSVTPADTATYYCARKFSVGAGFDYWGQGTMVTVTTETATAPDVFPLSPCCQDDSEVSLVCLVSGYFPEPVQVQWNSGAITSGIKSFPALWQSSSSHYTLSSQLTIPLSKWESEKIQCNVAHTATSSNINKEFEPCQKNEPVPPEVRLLHSSCNDATIELLCIISSFYPSEVTVDWLVGGKSGLLAAVNDQPKKDNEGYTFSTTSQVNISREDWLEGHSYACQVTHPGSQTKVKSQAKKCKDDSGCTYTGISISTASPTPKSLYIDRNPKVACLVSNLDNDEGLKVTWQREKQGTLLPDPLDVQEQSDGTYTALSMLPVTTSDWNGGEAFTCNVENTGLPGPIVKKIVKSKDKMTAPQVYLYRPHHEQIANGASSLTLTCLIQGFSPMDVSVQWLQNHNALSEDNHVNTQVMKESTSNSYFMYSKMTIPRSEWNSGSSYTCMVVHEGFEMKFTQRTVENSQGKK